MNSKKIAVTTGDVNGIGAEITIKALNRLVLPKENVVLISNSGVLDFYGKLNRKYEIVEIDYDKKNILPGKITADSGNFGFKALQKACEIAKAGEVSAIVTAPLSKLAMNKAGHLYSGQTEVLQKYLAHDGQKAEMLFVAKDFRVLLLTRHVPLKDVNLAQEMIVDKVERLAEFFTKKLGVQEPKFALCALNPHAGEGGLLGSEEIEILNPAVEKLRKTGINITEPLPADTLFIGAAENYSNNRSLPYDCYIANYHDQGLIPIKTIDAKHTVNMTIGLDIIRTSPSHGTAFDITGKNQASDISMQEAILQAIKN